MIIVSDVGLLGPYVHVQVMEDRLRVWPIGTPETELGADLPLEVIGAWQQIDVELPPGFVAGDYTWDGTQLLRKVPSE